MGENVNEAQKPLNQILKYWLVTFGQDLETLLDFTQFQMKDLNLSHFQLTKTYMDFPVIMPKIAMMEDEGSLPELVSMAGIQGISINEKKIGDSYIEFVLSMLDHFDVEIYYDSDRVEPQEDS